MMQFRAHVYKYKCKNVNEMVIAQQLISYGIMLRNEKMMLSKSQ